MINERRFIKRIPKCISGTLIDKNSLGDKIPITITQITADGNGIRFFSKYKLWTDKEFTISYPYQNQDLSYSIRIIWTKKNCNGYFFGCCRI